MSRILLSLAMSFAIITTISSQVNLAALEENLAYHADIMVNTTVASHRFKAANLFKSDTRITKGEREVSKRRAEIFFKLKPGEFISFADGKDKKVKFYLPEIIRGLPEHSQMYSTEDLKANFERVYIETRAIFQE